MVDLSITPSLTATNRYIACPASQVCKIQHGGICETVHDVTSICLTSQADPQQGPWWYRTLLPLAVIMNPSVCSNNLENDTNLTYLLNLLNWKLTLIFCPLFQQALNTTMRANTTYYSHIQQLLSNMIMDLKLIFPLLQSCSVFFAKQEY